MIRMYIWGLPTVQNVMARIERFSLLLLFS